MRRHHKQAMKLVALSLLACFLSAAAVVGAATRTPSSLGFAVSPLLGGRRGGALFLNPKTGEEGGKSGRESRSFAADREKSNNRRGGGSGLEGRIGRRKANSPTSPSGVGFVASSRLNSSAASTADAVLFGPPPPEDAAGGSGLLAIRTQPSTLARGGGDGISTSASRSKNLLKKLATRKHLSAALAGLTLLAVAYRYRDVLLNKERIQDEALRLLRRLDASDGDFKSLARSLSLYGCGMAAWEFFGLSTIPVETAAG